MGVTSDEMRTLTAALQDLTKAVGENNKNLDQSNKSEEVKKPETPAAFQGAFGKDSVFTQGAKSDTAPGFGLSAIRQMLASSGNTGAAGLIGGLASGGLVGMGQAAVSEIAKIGGDYLGIARSGREAARATPLGTSFAGQEAARRSAEDRSSFDFFEKYSFESGLLGLGTEYGGGITSRDSAQRGNDRVRGFKDLQEERRVVPEQAAEADTFRQLAPLAAAGADVESPEFYRLMNDFGTFNLKRERGLQQLRENLRTVISAANETTPGAQGQYGGK